MPRAKSEMLITLLPRNTSTFVTRVAPASVLPLREASAASQALRDVGVQAMHNVIRAPPASGESFKSQPLRRAITFKKTHMGLITKGKF